MLTIKQQEVLKLYLEGWKAADIQREMGMSYINSVYQILNSLKLQGKIPIKNEE